MSTYYIKATEKSSTAPRKASEIQAYCIASSKSGVTTKYTKQYFIDYIYKTADTYLSYNATTGAEARCELRTHPTTGEKFLQSVANHTETDNLVNLPDC